MENTNHILLFKTDISKEVQKQLLHGLLDSYPDITGWSIDLEDTDCVLRIVSPTVTHEQIIKLINHHGHSCCELI